MHFSAPDGKLEIYISCLKRCCSHFHDSMQIVCAIALLGVQTVQFQDTHREDPNHKMYLNVEDESQVDL